MTGEGHHRSFFYRYKRVIGTCAGVCLLGAAGVAIGQNAEQARQAAQAAASASWWLVAPALILPAVNWLIMSLSFWILMRRLGRITFSEMACLIGSAWLLNYLPLRPGLVGRVAYHKLVNKVPVSQSVGVTVLSLCCAGVAIGVMLGACASCAALDAGPRSQLVMIVAIPILMALIATVMCRAIGTSWWVAATILLRYLDLVTWLARYLLVFAIIGRPLSVAGAAAIAAIGQVAMLIPLVGNGLGLREWSVGFVAGALPPGVVSDSGRLTTATGLLADLVNRAAELACAVPIGLVCAAELARRKSLMHRDLKHT